MVEGAAPEEGRPRSPAKQCSASTTQARLSGETAADSTRPARLSCMARPCLPWGRSTRPQGRLSMPDERPTGLLESKVRRAPDARIRSRGSGSFPIADPGAAVMPVASHIDSDGSQARARLPAGAAIRRIRRKVRAAIRARGEGRRAARRASARRAKRRGARTRRRAGSTRAGPASELRNSGRHACSRVVSTGSGRRPGAHDFARSAARDTADEPRVAGTRISRVGIGGVAVLASRYRRRCRRRRRPPMPRRRAPHAGSAAGRHGDLVERTPAFECLAASELSSRS